MLELLDPANALRGLKEGDRKIYKAQKVTLTALDCPVEVG